MNDTVGEFHTPLAEDPDDQGPDLLGKLRGVLRRGGDQPGQPGQPGAPGPVRQPRPEDDDPENQQVSLGDRLRGALSSSSHKEPLYPRVLRLQHVHPNGWQRAVLVEGMALAGGLAALADLATAWAPVILPIGTAAVVKFHDILAGLLPRERP